MREDEKLGAEVRSDGNGGLTATSVEKARRRAPAHMAKLVRLKPLDAKKGHVWYIQMTAGAPEQVVRESSDVLTEGSPSLPSGYALVSDLRDEGVTAADAATRGSPGSS